MTDEEAMNLASDLTASAIDRQQAGLRRCSSVLRNLVELCGVHSRGSDTTLGRIVHKIEQLAWETETLTTRCETDLKRVEQLLNDMFDPTAEPIQKPTERPN